MISGGVGVSERTAEGATMANLWVTDLGGGVRQQRRMFSDEIAGLDGPVLGQRADGEMIAGIVDVGQVIEAADVDHHRRVGETKLHHGKQRVATGHEFRLVTVLGESSQRLIGRTGPDIVERDRNHFEPPAAVITAVTMFW